MSHTPSLAPAARRKFFSSLAEFKNARPMITGPQSDCPRYSVTKTYAENFNGGSETTVTNSRTAVSGYSLATGIAITGTRIDTVMTGEPDGLFTRSYYGSSGWSEGLPLATEDCTGTGCSDRKRWTWTNWTQDNTSLAYVLNPRVTESKVGDTTNVKRTTIDYYQPTTGVFPYGLPETVQVYAADQSTVIKKSVTTYNLTANYTDRRIIGLPAQVEAWGWNDLSNSLEYVSKVAFAYDEENFSYESNQNISSVIQHDAAGYSSSFYVGRGNLTSTTRYDVTNLSSAVTSRVRYDIAGSVVAALDPLNRKTAIDYSDNFNDTTTTRNTYAYPKILTDSAGNVSTIKYRFDTGANVWAKSPDLDSSTSGKESTREYDSIGRILRATIINNGAYTRYEYPTNGIQSKVYATLVDTDNDGADADDETLSESWFDGAGRVRRSRSEHPGSTGGWSATQTEYDILGRVKRSTVPTEVSVNTSTNVWAPAGDDDRGLDGSGNPVWLWNSQEYDWKGRVTRVVPSDSTGTDGKDTIISYAGCGCAGGQETTIQGENIVETDWAGNNPTTLGRRKQKLYEDILGRTYKSETYEWGGSTVYSTNVDSFNGRDQVVRTRQYSGTTLGSYRDVTMSYDGHGRMSSRHYPIEDTGTQTFWTYNADDSINTVTDPRGVVTNFGYYSTTGLLHTISYDVPTALASAVPDPGDVTFSYDNVGLRTGMSDGTGSSSYTYNSLGQMLTETKTFSGITDSFTTHYSYDLSGALETVSDPLDSTREFDLAFDKTGRVISANLKVGNASTNYLHDTKYRAWGDLKEYKYDNHSSTSVVQTYFNFNYDAALRVSTYESGSTIGSAGTQTIGRYADGKVRKVTNGVTNFWDRTYQYDHLGRVTVANTGNDANGDANSSYGPYQQTIAYNAFSEVTGNSGENWNVPLHTYGKTYATATGRASGSSYDAAGDVTAEPIYGGGTRTMTFDAAGHQVVTYDPAVHTCCENNNTTNSYYDGNGWMVKTDGTSGSNAVDPVYQFRSTVLHGETIAELSHAGTSNPQKNFTLPVLGGKLTSAEVVNYSDSVTFTRTGPDGLFEYSADQPTQFYDPRGADAGVDDPANTTGFQDGTYPRGTGDPLSFERCAEGGIPVSCDKQERFEKRFLELEAQIERDAEKNKRPPSGSSHGSSTTGQHEMIHTERNSFAARQTNATSKPDDDPALGGGVAPASLPVDSGDGCEYGTNGGPNNCFVQSWPWEDVDASLGQTAQNPFPGFDKEKFQMVQNALKDGKEILGKPDCLAGLAKAGIDTDDLVTRFNKLSARAELDSSVKDHNIFYAEKSTDPQVKDFLKTESGKNAGGFIFGQDIMLRNAFFNAHGSAKIDPTISRALALIHETIHLTGKSDDFFGGSSKLNDVVIKACYSKLFSHNDLAIVGN